MSSVSLYLLEGVFKQGFSGYVDLNVLRHCQLLEKMGKLSKALTVAVKRAFGYDTVTPAGSQVIQTQTLVLYVSLYMMGMKTKMMKFVYHFSALSEHE